jgi:hypothetical protein
MSKRIGMATIKTYGEQLEEVQTAISKVLAGQRYEINGRSVWRADLEWLYRLQNDLIDRIEQSGPDAAPGKRIVSGSYRVSFT